MSCICSFVWLWFLFIFCDVPNSVLLSELTLKNLNDTDDRSCLNSVTVKKEELQCLLSYVLKPTKGDTSITLF